jgi:6-phosphogluconolactonase/glucosamine-6-phosphate isomerase/deaminase
MEEVIITQLDSTNPTQDAAKHIFTVLTAKHFFECNSVMLLSGGSAIGVAKELLSLLPADTSLSSVTFALADERWVDLSSKDSNAVQLTEAGVIAEIEKRGGTFIPLLTSDVTSPEELVLKANAIYEELLKQAEQIVMIAGIGADGHTAGMLPHATSEEFELFSQAEHVVSYTIPEQSDNPFKQRITTTLATLSFVDTVFLYATGEEKAAVLNTFIKKDQPLHQVPALSLYLSQQPVQLLTTIPL